MPLQVNVSYKLIGKSLREIEKKVKQGKKRVTFCCVECNLMYVQIHWGEFSSLFWLNFVDSIILADM